MYYEPLAYKWQLILLPMQPVQTKISPHICSVPSDYGLHFGYSVKAYFEILPIIVNGIVHIQNRTSLSTIFVCGKD
jgi:hypothetical protein